MQRDHVHHGDNHRGRGRNHPPPFSPSAIFTACLSPHPARQIHVDNDEYDEYDNEYDEYLEDPSEGVNHLEFLPFGRRGGRRLGGGGNDVVARATQPHAHVPPPTTKTNALFAFDAVEKFLNCVPLAVDPRSPRSRARDNVVDATADGKKKKKKGEEEEEETPATTTAERRDDDDDDDRVSKRDVDRGSDRSSRTVRSRRRRGALAGRGAGQIVREESERPSIRRLERGRRGAARSRDDGRHIGGRGEGGQRRRFQNRRSGIRLRRRRRRSRLRRRGRRRNRRDVSRCRRSSPSDPRGHGIRNHRRGGRGAVEPPPRGKLVVRSQSRVRGEGVVGVVEGGHDVRVRRRGPGQLQRGQRRAVVLRRGGQSRVSGR
mmetsp:Transcript_6091/g.12527  ORF Transcript_6091/g.12527 Transcript_6091/m.12527 type:complete len:374 (+) Transcript_6091:324-1445(+)